MKIKFTNYDDGIHHFDFLENVDDPNLDERFSGKLKINCKMDKSHHQIVIDCDIHFNAELTCDRCMATFERAYSEHLQSIYFNTYDNENVSEEDPGIYFLSPNEDKIDISNDVIDTMNLSLPMKVLCSDECKGLCSMCGQSLNEAECNCDTSVENPVWDKLKKLKENLK